MPEPFRTTLINSVIEVTGSCSGVVKKIQSLYGTYSSARATLEFLSSECSSTAAALGSISELLKSKPESLTTSDSGSGLTKSLEDAVGRCSNVIDALNREISKYSASMGFSDRARYMINEDDLTKLLQRIRDERSTVTFVMSCLQTEALVNLQSKKSPVQASVTLAHRPKSALQDHYSKQLYQSILFSYHDEPAKIEEYLHKGADPNVLHERGGTPLHMAVLMGHMRILKLLLATGADMNVVSPEWGTPLIMALDGMKIAIAIELIDMGADVTRGYSKGMNALNMAINRKLDLCVIKLLKAGASPNVEGLEAPLYAALTAAQRSPAIVEALLDYGADIGRCTEDGLAPIHVAALTGSADMIRLLLRRGADIEATTQESKSTALFLAIKKGHAEAVRTLLDNGASASKNRADGWSALSHAIDQEQLEIVELLARQRGVDVDALDGNGFSALQHAADRGDIKIAQALIRNGGDLTKASLHGSTTLQLAARTGRLEMVRWIINQGIYVDVRGELDYTPLLEACSRGHTEVAKLLLERGAYIEFHSTSGPTPLSTAVGEEHFETAKLLLSHGASTLPLDGLAPLHWACFKANRKMAELLLDHGADVNVVGTSDATPLGVAVHVGSIPLMQLLTKRGANIDFEDSIGDGHLASAAVSDKIPAATFLVARGLDVNKTNRAGTTALHYAAAEGFKDMAEWLLSMGCDKTAVSEDMKGDGSADYDKWIGLKGTPSEVARMKGHEEVAKAIDDF